MVVDFYVGSGKPVLPDFGSETGARKTGFFGSITSKDVTALRLFGILGNDLDHPIHRVGSPEGFPRTANHFNSIDVFKERVLSVPIDTPERWVVNGPTVQEHQQLRGKAVRETP